MGRFLLRAYGSVYGLGLIACIGLFRIFGCNCRGLESLGLYRAYRVDVASRVCRV